MEANDVWNYKQQESTNWFEDREKDEQWVSTRDPTTTTKFSKLPFTVDDPAWTFPTKAQQNLRLEDAEFADRVSSLPNPPKADELTASKPLVRVESTSTLPSSAKDAQLVLTDGTPGLKKTKPGETTPRSKEAVAKLLFSTIKKSANEVLAVKKMAIARAEAELDPPPVDRNAASVEVFKKVARERIAAAAAAAAAGAGAPAPAVSFAEFVNSIPPEKQIFLNEKFRKLHPELKIRLKADGRFSGTQSEVIKTFLMSSYHS